jgi:hypothetical protein
LEINLEKGVNRMKLNEGFAAPTAELKFMTIREE